MKVDEIVENSINFLKERSNVGIKKYKTTLKDNNKDDFLQHLAEELGDALNYTMKLKDQEKNNTKLNNRILQCLINIEDMIKNYSISDLEDSMTHHEILSLIRILNNK